jgi:ABC-type multidrug transport system fused ATPase/permease subunit
VKAFSNEDAEIQKFEAGNEFVFRAGRKKAIFSAIFAFMTQFMLYAAMAAVVYVAAKLY